LGTQLQQQVANPFYGIITTGPLSLPTVQRGQLELPFPEYQSTTDFGGYVGDSSYHSLQVKAEKRFSSGGNILAAYTFSKILTNTETLTSWLEGGSTGTGAAGVQDYTNLRAERALSSFDSRQRLTIGYVVDLPFGKGKKFLPGATGFTDKLVSGWGLNGLITFQDGFPLALGATPNLTGFNTGLRPNVVNGCNKTLDGPAQARLSRWFNTSCFSVPGAFTFGNESRTDPDLRGQGIANYDIALFKKTNLTERVHLEFRTEAFNLFNRVKFGNPNLTTTTAANSTFGVVSTQLNTPRLIQLALRLQF
ncbi:MAG: TonB-dependent receptor, partial [Bryobacteraceae bacterium]